MNAHYSQTHSEERLTSNRPRCAARLLTTCVREQNYGLSGSVVMNEQRKELDTRRCRVSGGFRLLNDHQS